MALCGSMFLPQYCKPLMTNFAIRGSSSRNGMGANSNCHEEGAVSRGGRN